ncbi:MAG: hypothetical protein [Siphoviridae sp. ctvD11]|nr:MAG: hypothetical protein [Siphoviridae sp. ctvD11]
MSFEPWRGGRGKTKFTYTYADIAALTGLSIGTLRVYRSKGLLDPEDLQSVVDFCKDRL